VSGSNSAVTVNSDAMLAGTSAVGATTINPPAPCTAQILRPDPVEQGADCGQMVERMDALFANEREINAKPRTTAPSGKADCRSPSRKLASKTLRPKLLDPAHFSETRVGFTGCACHHSLVRS
jgi:hypothetical protein